MVKIESAIPPRVFGNNDTWHCTRTGCTHFPDVTYQRWVPLDAFSGQEIELRSVPFLTNTRVLKAHDREGSMEGKP